MTTPCSPASTTIHHGSHGCSSALRQGRGWGTSRNPPGPASREQWNVRSPEHMILVQRRGMWLVGGGPERGALRPPGGRSRAGAERSTRGRSGFERRSPGSLPRWQTPPIRLGLSLASNRPKRQGHPAKTADPGRRGPRARPVPRHPTASSPARPLLAVTRLACGKHRERRPSAAPRHHDRPPPGPTRGDPHHRSAKGKRKWARS